VNIQQVMVLHGNCQTNHLII